MSMALPNPGAKEGPQGSSRTAEQRWSKDAGLPSNSLPREGELKWDIDCVCSCGATVALPSAFPPASIELWVWISWEGLATSVSCTTSSSRLLQEVAAGRAVRNISFANLLSWIMQQEQEQAAVGSPDSLPQDSGAQSETRPAPFTHLCQ